MARRHINRGEVYVTENYKQKWGMFFSPGIADPLRLGLVNAIWPQITTTEMFIDWIWTGTT